MQQITLGERYTLLELLGGGGMAKVYLAHDNVLGRDVALKVLREQFAEEEEFVERFKREAKNAAALNHSNIVQVYDRGRSEDGTYYIAMEYVPGGTLKERIAKEGALEPGEATGVALRVAEALVVAHERGVVHRDIKSQNVLLSASGEAKVADFGIARAAASKTVTEPNLVLGTVGYMSPEQVSGESVGPASDLYSLGIVLYEMLTGRLPYSAADNPFATAMKHLEDTPRHPREENPRVPEDIDALTAKLLAKRPEDRYSSAASLAEDLRRVRDGLSPLAAGSGEPTTARMPPDVGKTRPIPGSAAPRRPSGAPASLGRRWALAVPLGVLLLGMALLGGLTWALGWGTSNQGALDATGGAERVKVPNVVGLPQNEAQKQLQEARLKLGSQDEAPSNEVAAGTVIEQDPAARTEVDRGTAVGVVVSTGPLQEPTPQASPSAPATASPTALPSASSAAKAANKEAQKRLEEAQKRAEERQKERQKGKE